MENRKVARALIPIYGTTFADTLGYTLMIPLIPALVHQYHANDVAGGALLSIPAFCSAIAAPIWGKVSDRTGRKPIIIAAQVFSLAGYALLAGAHSIGLILLSRMISGLGGGSLGAVESYIADVTQDTQRERAYSFYGAIFGIAFMIGPPMSGALMHYGIAVPFVAAALLELLNIIFTVTFLPKRQSAQRRRTSVIATVRSACAPGVRRVFIRQFLFIFAVVCFLANFALYSERAVRLDAPHASYALAVAGAIGGAGLLLLVTPLAKRFGDQLVSQLGIGLDFIAYALFAFASRPWVFFLALAIWAIGAATAEPSLTTLLSKRAKEDERGALMGLSDSINSVAMIAGPAAGAVLVGSNGRMLGLLCAVASAAAVALGWKARS